MNYDLDKIRRACLELMGWKHVGGTRWWSESEARAGYAHAPDHDCMALPDPTRSLDDALPLFDLGVWTDNPSMSLNRWRSGDDSWCGTSSITNQGPSYSEVADSPPLAICLWALCCAGRDLKEFEKGDHERD